VDGPVWGMSLAGSFCAAACSKKLDVLSAAGVAAENAGRSAQVCARRWPNSSSDGRVLRGSRSRNQGQTDLAGSSTEGGFTIQSLHRSRGNI